MRVIGGRLLRTDNSGRWARGATIGFATAAATAALLGQVWPMAVAGFAAACCDRMGGFIAGFRPESSVWRAIALAGTVMQILSLAIADRGLMMGPGGWALGSGGMTLVLAILLGMALRPMLTRRRAPVMDFGAAWVVAGPLIMTLGWRDAFDAAGIAAGIVLLIAILRMDHGNAAALPISTGG